MSRFWRGYCHILTSGSTRKTHGGSGNTHDQIVLTELLKLQKKRSVSRWACKNRLEHHKTFVVHYQATEGRFRIQGIFTTTGRILFYNSWKENFGKLKMHCSEFQEWLIHLYTEHGALYCPYTLVPDPHIFHFFLKLWSLYRPARGIVYHWAIPVQRYRWCRQCQE